MSKRTKHMIFCRTRNSWKPTLTARLLAAALVFASTSGVSQTHEPVSSRMGKVYDGVLSARVIPPKSSGHRAQSHHGDATAVLESTGGGSAQFILSGTLLQDGDASFLAPGRFAGADWAGSSDTFRLEILADGTVRGEGAFQGQPTTFDGTFKNDDLDLVVEMKVPDETQGGSPAGTVFQFRYQLRHFPERTGESDSGSGRDGGCREVVYRLKLTPNLFGSGLSSVRVPECRH